MQPPNYLIKIAVDVRNPAADVYAFFALEPGKKEIEKLARQHKVEPGDCVLFKLTEENRARIVANSRWFGWTAELQIKEVSIAARVACNASSTRAFFSFISSSLAAPTLMSATPPESLATRSCSFSLS